MGYAGSLKSIMDRRNTSVNNSNYNDSSDRVKELYLRNGEIAHIRWISDID
jgi:hypothetical protein